MSREAFFNSCITVSSFRVSEDMPLYDMLNEFQKGHSHLAVVYKDLNKKNDVLEKTKGGEVKDNCKKHKAGTRKSKRKGKNI